MGEMMCRKWLNGSKWWLPGMVSYVPFSVDIEKTWMLNGVNHCLPLCKQEVNGPPLGKY